MSKGNENQKGGQTLRNLGTRCENRIVCGRGEYQNVEVDTGVIEVVCVSSDSAVISGFPLPHCLAPDFLLTATGCVCFPGGSQRFVPQIEKSFRYESGIQFAPKEGKYMLRQQERHLFS